MALEAEESFEGLAEFALKGLSRLDPGTQAALVEEAAAMGIASERADRLIGRICRRLGVARERGACNARGGSPAAAPAPRRRRLMSNGSAKFSLLRCRHCAGVTEMSPVARKAGSARCRHCGASLKWDCPVCKQQSLGRRAAVRLRIPPGAVRAAGAAFRGGSERLSQLRTETGTRAPGTGAGVCTEPRRRRNGIAKIRQRQAGYRTRPAWLTRQRGPAAGWSPPARPSKPGAGWSIPASPELQAAWSELVEDLLRAETLAAKARNLERTDPAAARALYRQSLAIAADLPEALAGLKRTPPDPPTALDAQVMGDRIRLSWTPPPPDGLGPLTFVVVRKRGGSLEHPADGTRIAEVSTSEFDDMHVAPGDTVGYAVLEQARRGRVDRRDLARPVCFPGRCQGRAGRVSPTRGRAGLVASARRHRRFA